MKIENFALDLHSKSSKSSSSTITSFVSELDSQNVKRLEEVEAVQEQLEFTKRLKFEMIQQLISSLDSRKFKLKSIDSEQFKAKELTTREVSIHKEYKESQKLNVSMCGFIQTSTKKIEISMDISMSHSFVSDHQLTHQIFHDPLVLNFDGELPELDTENFSFDIDNDGKKDQISMLKNGSGFLALDKNSNNKIDEGSELFGTLNGNGFSDLKQYDSDGNNWIDENDPILDKLRIWIKNKDEDKLIGLGELGIGALYVGNTKGQIDIKSQTNETLGRIRANGLYLNENGTSGLLSQIDFALQNKEANINIESSGLNELLKIV
jgi:hypothetical protein